MYIFLAFSMNEMGSGLSDNYSYLDMSADDLVTLEDGMAKTVEYFRQYLKEEGFEV